MKVLVTGATGALGQAAVARLLGEGHDVAIVTRRPFLADRLFGSSVAVHEWHPISERLPPDAIDGRACVLHLMGAPISGGPARDRLARAETSRVTATRRLAEAMAGRPARLVVASLAFAPTWAASPLTEQTTDCAPATPGERVIAAWEAEARAIAERGASVAIVRFGLIASANAGPLGELARLARRGFRPDLTGSLIPAISLEDATAVLVALLRRGDVEGLVHGVAPTPLSGEALADALAKLSPMPMLPGLPVSMLGLRLGLAAMALTCRRHVISQVLEDAGTTLSGPDPTASFVRALADPSAKADRVRPAEPPAAGPARPVSPERV